MLSGTLTRDSLVSVFRALSLKQRQGILEVTIPNSYYELCFHDGVVVEVKGTEDSVARAITNRLLDGGFITKELTAALSDVELTVEQLFEFLVGDGHVDECSFVSAKRAVEHDIIVTLADSGEGFFNFTPKLIQYRSELSMRGYPGQLLLDIVEYDNDRERFEDIFEDARTSDVIVCKTGEPATSLTAPEAMVWSQIQIEDSIQRIYEGTLLSLHDLQQALLSLYDRNLIGVAVGEDEMSVEEACGEVLDAEDESDADEDGVTGTLRLKVQKEHAEPQEQKPSFRSEQALRAKSAPRGRVEQEEPADVETLIDKAVTLLRGMDASIAGGDTNYQLKEVEEKLPSLFEDEDPGDLFLSEEDAADEDSFSTPDGDRQAAYTHVDSADSDADDDFDDDEYYDADEVVDAPQSISARSVNEQVERDYPHAAGLEKVNYVLLETRVAYNMAIILVLVFLVALAFIAPPMLDNWFSALSAFSSK